MAIGNEEELFSEASGELRDEVEDALDRARESLPDQESVVVEEDTALSEVVADLPAELDPSEPAEALRTAQKRVALGNQADAFDEEFIEEVTTALDQIAEAVDALWTVGEIAPELAGALTTLEEVEVRADTQVTQTDSSSPEPESGVSNGAPGTDEESPVESDTDRAEDSPQQAITELPEETNEGDE